MKKFLVLYEAPVSAMEQMAKATPAQQKAGKDAWMTWKNKNSKSVIDLGNPLGNGAQVQKGSTSKSKSTVAGFSILQGDSIDAIKKVMADHPHLHMPGASIEVFEYLPMPIRNAALALALLASPVFAASAPKLKATERAMQSPSSS